MFDPRNTACPCAGMKRTCHQVREKWDCPKWISFFGTNPNTGEKVAEWACADRWQPFLLADLNSKLIGVQAAVESRGDATSEQQARSAAALERIAAATPIIELEPPFAARISPPVNS